MRGRPGLGCKRIFGLFRAQGTCLVAENVQSLAHRPLQGGVKRGKREEKDGKRKARKRRKGREKKNSPK